MLERRQLELEFAVCPVGMADGKYLKSWDADRKSQLKRVLKAADDIRRNQRLVAPYDEEFAKYWDTYADAKSFALRRKPNPDGTMAKDEPVFEMPDGRLMTQYQLLVQELREQIIAAQERLKEHKHERDPRKHNLLDSGGGQSSLDSQG